MTIIQTLLDQHYGGYDMSTLAISGLALVAFIIFTLGLIKITKNHLKQLNDLRYYNKLLWAEPLT